MRWRHLDYVLIAAVAGLIALGTALIWAATKQQEINRGLDSLTFVKHNVINVIIGCFFGALAARVDYRLLRAYAPLLYVASILGLLAVLSPLGSSIFGAHSWIVLPGGFDLEPSEFCKLALVLGTAMVLAERRDGENAPANKDVVLVLALAAVPMVLVLAQPDFGMTMVFVATLLGLLAVAGVSTKWVIGLTLAGVLAGGVILGGGVLKGYQQDRLTSFANAAHCDPQKACYNVTQAELAIGSGHLTGTGLGNGKQTNGGFVPVQQSDFVFSVAGEETGLIGSGVLLLMLFTVLWRGLRIARGSPDLFGRILAAGIVTWFSFQSFVNIGMTLGLMPVTGLPLVFVSYGGSSMIANLIAIGLLQNVYLRSRSRTL
jgi:rod shape determining protein RodA